MASRDDPTRRPVEKGLSLRSRQQPGQDLEQRGFPTARRPDDGDELSLRDGEIDVLQRHDGVHPAAVALRQVADRDDVAGGVRPGGQDLCAGSQSMSPLVPGSGLSASLRGRVLCPGRLLWEGSPGQRKAGATNRRYGGAKVGQPMKYRCAILDDYQNVALAYGDWSKLAGEVEVKVFNQPFKSTEEVHRALKGFEIIAMMRERTAFLRNTIEALPDLKLLITTGAANKSIDLAAAAERGITVAGTGTFGNPTTGIAFGLILELTRRIGFENTRM